MPEQTAGGHPADPARASVIGALAIIMWSFLAVLTVLSAPVPPLQLSAIGFAIGGLSCLIWAGRSGGLSGLGRVPRRVYAFGTAGLFGYHFLYFSALRSAPPAQAGLIAYLWPLLIVLLSALLPGERLRHRQFAGALLAFSGAALVIRGGSGGLSGAHLPGYLLALGGAVVWSGYSVLSRRLAGVPSASVAVFCLFSALLALIAHLLTETTAWPASAAGWGAIALLGVGPLGLAFLAWDIGMKRGRIRLLGVLAYAAPLLSTAILVLAGQARAEWALLLAAAMISGGALLAGRDR